MKDETLATPQSWKRIDRFAVGDSLGSGGMGVVVAAHDPELDRAVAIKLLNPESVFWSEGLLHEQAQARLVREAQAMARVAHPNVVTVHEVGVHEQLVFIVMELIDGGTAASWVKQRPRSVREVLALYIAAGRGLAAAHAAGLIHRDFKPENVLVDRDDRPRVRDFGLVGCSGERAPSADESLSASFDAMSSSLGCTLTHAGQVIGTARYMAPEQHTGGFVDARSDQYNFCVALYEALYGERPFAGERYGELRDRVVSGDIREPPADSGVPNWLREILLRGLSVAPEDRYASVEELLAVLDRAPIAADAKVAGVWNDDLQARLTTGFVATSRPYARDAAERVSSVVSGWASDWKAMWTDAWEATRVHGHQSEHLLDLRIRYLDRCLAELGELVTLLANSPDEALVDRAVEAALNLRPLTHSADTDALLAAAPLPPSPNHQKAIEDLQRRLGRVHALDGAGRYAVALEEARDIADEAQAFDYALLRAEVLFAMGRLLHRTGAPPEEKRRLLIDAARFAGLARDDLLLARVWSRLAWCYGSAPIEAVDVLLAAAEAASERVADATARAEFCVSAASLLHGNGRPAEALTYRRRAADIARMDLGPDHIITGWALNDLGDSCESLGHFQSAREAYVEALASYQSLLGSEHPLVGIILQGIGSSSVALGELDAAEDALRRSIEIHDRSFGRDHHFSSLALMHLGDVHKERQRHVEARELYHRTLAIWRGLGSDFTWYRQSLVLTRLALLDLACGRSPDAAEWAQSAIAWLEEHAAIDDPELAEPLTVIAEIHLASEHPRAAAPFAERAVALLERAGATEQRLSAARRALGTASAGCSESEE